jgi:hypothetical protein
MLTDNLNDLSEYGSTLPGHQGYGSTLPQTRSLTVRGRLLDIVF